MVFIDSLTVTSAGNPTAIEVKADCTYLTLTEQSRAGTKVFNIFAVTDPTGIRTASIHPAGYEKRFDRRTPYRKGEIIGYVSLASGSATFILEHE